MKYVYYDPTTKQIEAVFDTPFLVVQSSWDAKGLTRAIVPSGMDLRTLDYKIDAVAIMDGEQVVERYSISPHPRGDSIA